MITIIEFSSTQAFMGELVTHNLAEFIGTVTGIAGAVMLAVKCRLSAWSWPLWIVSNIAWTFYALGLPSPAYGLIAQQVVFGVINVVGTWRWLYKPEMLSTKSSYEATSQVSRT